MKKYIISIICLFSASIILAQTKLGFDGENAASVGIYIKDLATGKVIAQNDPYRALLPASTMKTVTAAATLTALGENFAFKTPVYLSGRRNEKDNSEWLGNLVIESCGDPTIESVLFDDNKPLWKEILAALKKLGVSSIKGSIVIQEPLLEPGCVPEWEIGDVPWSYGAGLFGFNFHDNTFSLWPATGVTKPFMPNLDYDTVFNADHVNLIRGNGCEYLTVEGKDINSPKWRINTSMENPAIAYASLLENKMNEAEIWLQNEDIDDISNQQLICTYFSPLISDILKETLYESHNLFAEGMLRALAPIGTREDAIKEESRTLQILGVSTRYNKICDGSGLARADRLQPIFLSNMLEKMAKSKYGNLYVSFFPKVGEDGTVKQLLEKTRLKGQLALKSGSMNAVQCFAGYKIDSNGKPTHTVVILINGFFCSRGEVKGSIEKLLLDTF